MSESILIVEDDPHIAGLLEIHLGDLGYTTKVVANGNDGVEQALGGEFALIVLDIMLPGKNGVDVCKEIRAADNAVPIMMLTSKSDLVDIVVGLEVGADDYLTKPFKIEEFLARTKALLRRSSIGDRAERAGIEKPEREELDFGELIINLEKRRVLRAGELIELTARQFDLLSFLALRPGRPYSRQELLNYVWGYENTGYGHTVDTHINRLRSRVERDSTSPTYILTVWGVGYRFAELSELNV